MMERSKSFIQCNRQHFLTSLEKYCRIIKEFLIYIEYKIRHGDGVMGNRIPEEVVEQIRTSSDIVEVIGEYVQLRKQGRNYFGLCPFHGENSPSFSVSSDKQIFHCFGCGEGGNVFSFLMKMEGLAFTEAVQKLGERNGIAVAEYTSGQGQQEDISDDTVIMQQAHELLKKYYHHLLVNTEEGNEALSYLLNRGITKEMIEKFEIGYASPAWDAATKILQKEVYRCLVWNKLAF